MIFKTKILKSNISYIQSVPTRKFMVWIVIYSFERSVLMNDFLDADIFTK